MADEMVLQAQQWLNQTYKGRYGYNEIVTDGKTGWGTMFALTRALQIELGLGEPSDNFGNATLGALINYGDIGKNQNNSNQNIVKIIQSALFCKGYNSGAITGTFGENTEQAVIDLKTDLGLVNANGNITPKVFKALLTMDAYVLLKDTSLNRKIRIIQQWLNNRYNNRSNFFFKPCDGIFSRETQTALIYAIQYEEGISDETANGNFGPTTKSKLPILSVGSRDNTTQFVHLLQAALCFNGYEVDFDGIFGNGTGGKVKEFQKFCMLTSDGVVGQQTWADLLISYGDASRKTTACDTRFEITQQRANILKYNGYTIVGRYLTGGDFKQLRENELQLILDNGLKVFPIFQESGTDIGYFTRDRAKQDIKNAILAAKRFGFPIGTTIYFAVDLDVMDYQITSHILPYFEKLSLGNDGTYEIGIYGTRNVCTRICNAGYASSSFVSNMSSGYSGNLGFVMPTNWNYSQIANVTISDNNGNTLEIDKDVYRDIVPAVSTRDTTIDVKYVSSDDQFMNDTRKEQLKSEIIEQSNKDMSDITKQKALRTREENANLLMQFDNVITELSEKYKVRKALIQSIFMRESCCEGVDDTVADQAVENYYLYEELFDQWSKLPPLEKVLTGQPELILPRRSDSSTGYCQIFANTAIDAHNNAVDMQLISENKYDKQNWRDVYQVWSKLKGDSEYNIKVATLVLIHNAVILGINKSTYEYNESEIKGVFEKYNGSGDEAVDYANKVYNLYVIFEKYNKMDREGI